MFLFSFSSLFSDTGSHSIMQADLQFWILSAGVTGTHHYSLLHSDSSLLAKYDRLLSLACCAVHYSLSHLVNINKKTVVFCSFTNFFLLKEKLLGCGTHF